MPDAFEFDALCTEPIAQARELRTGLVEQAAVVGQRAEQRVGQLLGRGQVLRRRREMRIRLHPRSHEGRDVTRREHEVAHPEQRDAVEHGALARGGQQHPALIGELLHRQRAGVRAQRHHLGRHAEAQGNLGRVARRPQNLHREAAGLGSRQRSHQSDHLMKLEHSQVTFTHRVAVFESFQPLGGLSRLLRGLALPLRGLVFGQANI